MTASQSMIDEIPVEGTHSCLQFFDPAQLLVNYSRGYDEEVFTSTSPDGPILEFELSGAKSQMSGSVIDPRSLELQLTIEMIDTNSTENTTDKSAYVNNIMHSLFSNCELFLNGVQVSNANNLYPHKVQVETEVSHPTSCKEGILVCQGYQYESDPSDITDGESFKKRRKTANSGLIHLYGRLAIDFLSTPLYILPDVEMRIRLTRASSAFVTLATDATAGSTHTIKIKQASLHVHKLELKTETFQSIERGLSKRPARYPFNEVILKSFVVSTGSTQFHKDDLFNREPISRILFAMNDEASFTGKSTSNPFHYQKFNLQRISFEREGASVGGTPLLVTNDTRSYHNTLKSLGVEHFGNGITPDEFENHYIHVFLVTADSRPSDNTLRPELTGGRLGVNLDFKTPLTAPIRIFFYGERQSNVYISGKREVLKNSKFYYG